jgi:hypothetical protein
VRQRNVTCCWCCCQLNQSCWGGRQGKRHYHSFLTNLPCACCTIEKLTGDFMFKGVHGQGCSHKHTHLSPEEQESLLVETLRCFGRACKGVWGSWSCGYFCHLCRVQKTAFRPHKIVVLDPLSDVCANWVTYIIHLPENGEATVIYVSVFIWSDYHRTVKSCSLFSTKVHSFSVKQ